MQYEVLISEHIKIEPDLLRKFSNQNKYPALAAQNVAVDVVMDIFTE